ncbi:MAG TPA: nuclear transport factor 2 family protein [Polyangiaceae bacterium]|nr:nuclear transport factor 2 family protein [Polyangiaceae bacterium]
MPFAADRVRESPRRRASGRSEEAAIERVIDQMVLAIRTGNVEALISLCAPEIATFDMVPPLRHDGREALRKLWADALAAYERPLDYEVNQLEIIAGSDVAICRSLNRFGGSRKGADPVVNWLCSTICLRKIDGQWKIVHEHTSVPFDMRSGKALLHLGA